MGKVSGKTLQFWFDGVERPVEGTSFDSDYQELDVTDSSVSDNESEFLLNRTKRTLKVDALLAEADGAEIITGTLVKDTKYIVTLGTITETLVPATYPVGRIFTSDGTGTCSGANKVKPLGVKLKGKSVSCTIATVNCPVTAIKYNEQYGEFDATDSGTTGDATEFIGGRAKRTCSLDVLMLSTAADKLSADPADQAIVLTFGSGLTLTGTGVFKKKAIVAASKGDIVKVSYEVNFNGPVTSTLFGILASAVSKAAKVIYSVGVSTNKEQTGNLMILSTAIDADVNGLIKVSYTGNWIGAVTEAVAN